MGYFSEYIFSFAAHSNLILDLPRLYSWFFFATEVSKLPHCGITELGFVLLTTGGRGAEAGRAGQGAGVPLQPGGGAPGGGQSEEGGLRGERQDADQQEARAGRPHRQSAGRPLKLPAGSAARSTDDSTLQNKTPERKN